MGRNYYELLGVSEDASVDEIRVAYRAAMLKNHPDLHEGGGADKNSRNLNLAYETLSSAVRRAQYDDRLRRHRTRQSERRNAEPSNPDSQSSTPANDTDLASLFHRNQLVFVSSVAGLLLFFGWVLLLLVDPFSFFVVETVSQPTAESASELDSFDSDDNGANKKAGKQTAEAPIQAETTEITPTVPADDLPKSPTLPEEESEDSSLPANGQEAERRPSESIAATENSGEVDSNQSVTDGMKKAPESFLNKQTIPNKVDIAAAEEKIRLVFRDRYDSGNSREQKINLAQELLEVGMETNDDIAARYVLYQSASRIAVSTAAAPLYRRIVGALTNEFEIKEIDLLLAGYAAMIESPDAASKTSELLSVIAKDIFRYRAHDRLSNAKSLCDVGLNIARDTPDEQDLMALSDFIIWQMGKKTESANALATVASLSNIQSEPETARADLFVAGRYRCFSQGNWRVGLPLLANGSDQRLSNLARLEITEGENAASKIGNAWWDYSNKDGLSVYERAHIQHHASEWLKLAVDDLSGLDKMLAEKRLRDSVANTDEISSYVKLAIEFDEVQGSTPIEVAHAWQQKTAGLPANGAFSLVAISGNGKIAAFLSGVLNSADGSNFIRLYSWDPKLQVWQQFGNDILQEAEQDRHGCSVALSDDGNTIAIGADMGAGNGKFGRAGQVRVYRWSASHTLWKQLGKSIKGKATADYFGCSVSLNADGNTLAIGARNGDASVTLRDGGQGNLDDEGQVSVFVWEDSAASWRQLGNIIDGEAPKDRSGSPLTLSADGTTIAIGAPSNSDAGQRSGHVRVYRWFKSIHSWKKLGNDIDGEVAGDNSGSSVALSANGEVVAIGAAFAGGNGARSGQIRVFKWQNRAKSWRQLGNHIQGQSAWSALGNRESLALTHNGQKLVFADQHGFVKIFEFQQVEEIWKQASFIPYPKHERVMRVRIAIDSSGETIGFWMYDGPSTVYQWTQSEFVESNKQPYDGSPDASEHQASEHSRPRLANAPFNAAHAKEHQEAWAKYLGIEVETENSIGMKLSVIPAGTFTMGENDDAHEVTLTKPFMLGTYEVTQAQYQKVMGTNPSQSRGINKPVERVSWDDAVEFCRKLSALPTEKAEGHVYCLPSEAEWEYACRAGTATKYSFGDNKSELGRYAWFRDNSNNITHPVGGKQPNAFGLHDMHGNVWEWCSDWRGVVSTAVATDPGGADKGSRRVDRGGGFESFDNHILVPNACPPEGKIPTIGFRVACRVTGLRFKPDLSAAFDTKRDDAPKPRYHLHEKTNTGPPLAIAPFDAAKAKEHQEAWAKYLGVEVETENSIGMKLRVIPAGTFMMGNDDEADKEKPVHQVTFTKPLVTLTKPFTLGTYEVTQAQYKKVMECNPSRFQGDNNPVEKVSWNDAVDFCRKLSELPAEKSAGRVYRLPTEAEWELACRAGTTTKYSFGDDELNLDKYAWWGGNSGSKTHSVGGKQPNAWGLYDMHGNVWEWCQDRYGAYPRVAVTDPTGGAASKYRVYRGGALPNKDTEVCRSAFRLRGNPDFARSSYVGFRVVSIRIKPKLKISRPNNPLIDFKLNLEFRK